MLNIDGLKLVEQEDHADHIILHVESDVERTHCPHCNSNELYKHGYTKPYSYNDTPLHGKHCALSVRLRRYRCRSCSKTCQDEPEQLSETRNMTSRLLDIVRKECFKNTFSELSRRYGINEKTVRNVFEDYRELLENTHKIQTPEYLGIDEVQTTRKTLRCAITNVKENRLVDFLPDRKKEFVDSFFEKMQDKQRVKAVAMDMWKPYRDEISKHFPSAIIVIDKFHVVRLACFAVDECRRSLNAEMPRKVKNRLKDERWLMLTKKENLDLDRQLELNIWFVKYPKLKIAYALKEKFFDFYKCLTKQQADEMLADWEKSVPSFMMAYFKPLVTAIRNWRPYILNYFDYEITNAYTESKNRLVKDLNRDGRGYSFEVLRTKLLFDETVMAKEKTSVRSRIRKKKAEPDSTQSFGKSWNFSVMQSVLPEKELADSNEYETEVIYKGPRFDTLSELLRSGHFD